MLYVHGILGLGMAIVVKATECNITTQMSGIKVVTFTYQNLYLR